MFIYVCIYIYRYMYMYMYIYICIYIGICICICIYIYVCIYIGICICICIYIYMYVCIYIGICICICIYMYVYIYRYMYIIYIYIYVYIYIYILWLITICDHILWFFQCIAYVHSDVPWDIMGWECLKLLGAWNLSGQDGHCHSIRAVLWHFGYSRGALWTVRLGGGKRIRSYMFMYRNVKISPSAKQRFQENLKNSQATFDGSWCSRVASSHWLQVESLM